jgi:predicted PhzF superfamily epimerase YddE/YHI9
MSQSTLTYVTTDVFTRTRYIGNPLAIVQIPAGTLLSQEQKQLIAREFNYSETVFLHLPADSSNPRNHYDIDIFTTYTELPFAGHPTIGTACYALGTLMNNSATDGKAATGSSNQSVVQGSFLTKAGMIKLEYDVTQRTARAAIPHNVRVHAASLPASEVLRLQPGITSAAFQRLNDAEGSEPQGFPVVSIVNGMTFTLIEFKDLEAMAPIGPLGEKIIVKLDEGWNRPYGWFYCYVRLPDSQDGSKNIRTRMVTETLEDPATGSAASALSSYLTLQEGTPGQSIKYNITQGVEMGRQSDIGVEVKLAEDGKKVESVHISGSAIIVMKGNLSV